MLPPEAVLAFADRQKKLLRKTYDDGWRKGVSAYQPDPDPQQNPSLPYELAAAGLGGVALLGVKRKYQYVAPTHPDPIRRVVALAPSFNGVNTMIGQLNAVVSGESPEIYEAGGDYGEALAQWIAANGWRLDAGDSVAWAGEQAGYAEAADADGQLLFSWITEGDSRVCSDCDLLSTYPPMPLSDWPTAPGAGDTECGPGCRCSWDTWDGAVSQFYSPRLSDQQQELANTLAQQQAEAISSMISDVAYLEG